MVERQDRQEKKLEEARTLTVFQQMSSTLFMARRDQPWLLDGHNPREEEKLLVPFGSPLPESLEDIVAPTRDDPLGPSLSGAHVSAACAEASSCKCMQVLSCLLAGRTFGRCRKAHQEWALKPSAFGLRLRKLAGKGLLSSQEFTLCASKIQALQCDYMHPRHQGFVHSHCASACLPWQPISRPIDYAPSRSRSANFLLVLQSCINLLQLAFDSKLSAFAISLYTSSPMASLPQAVQDWLAQQPNHVVQSFMLNLASRKEGGSTTGSVNSLQDLDEPSAVETTPKPKREPWEPPSSEEQAM